MVSEREGAGADSSSRATAGSGSVLGDRGRELAPRAEPQVLRAAESRRSRSPPPSGERGAGAPGEGNWPQPTWHPHPVTGEPVLGLVGFEDLGGDEDLDQDRMLCEELLARGFTCDTSLAACDKG
eukprot:1679146-Pyramimonas_sp.AAC.1